MTLRADIRGVLSAGPRTAEQISELCDITTKQAAQNLSALKSEGKIKVAGTVEGRNNYAIANWPEKGNGAAAAAAPLKAKGKRAKKSKRAPAAEIQVPAPAISNGAAKFAVLDDGTLALIKDAPYSIRMDLNQAEFARLRTFIERTEQAWNPPQE